MAEPWITMECTLYVIEMSFLVIEMSFLVIEVSFALGRHILIETVPQMV